MMRGELTHRIGRARIAGERKSLAAAAAEIDLAPLAALARLRQKIGAAERREGGRGNPDLLQRMVAHRPELESRDALGGVTGQHAPGRGDIERATAPATDA